MSDWVFVFRSKVLQRLFPVAPKLEKEPSPPRIVDALAKKTFVTRKTTQEDTATGDAGQTPSAANPQARVYTVLPPPADYKTHPEKSVTLSQPESMNSAKDPAEESVHESNEEQDQDTEQEEHKRKRKRKKRKPAPHQDSGQDGAAPGQRQTVAAVEGGEHISRNKKRKLKKKRHKEKLLSMGVTPRAAALEFTYQKDGGKEEEEEDIERRAAEVSDFLRTTLEIYLSDRKLHVDNKSLLLSGTVDNLLSHMSSGCEPNSVLKQLYSLKTSVQHKETAKLEKALQELHNTSSMTAGAFPAGFEKSFKRIRCRRFTVPILDHRYPSHAGRQDDGTIYHTPMRLSVTLKQRCH
ncbi:glutamate-rich protein 1 isoform X2 [Hippoglossus hippoglossus]|uniref:glutamate-rich protein 1 isoform X2 n=1 Tax=Hippoglossus hippoglossus TaxID=8267 RepID=UPI00148CF5C8|nr:glutamate-rich protein 1 isoform X2 [Hippoglossus hippoglossus]